MIRGVFASVYGIGFSATFVGSFVNTVRVEAKTNNPNPITTTIKGVSGAIFEGAFWPLSLTTRYIISKEQ